MIKKYFIHLIILILVGIAVYKNKDYLFVRLNPAEYADKYSASQYILGDGSNQWISDSELYVYAGHAYWLGDDPTTINFEHPPLRKYYYGVFLHILGNPYWGSVLLFSLILILINQITKELSFNLWQRSLAIFLTGSLSLLQIHTRYALLDLPQLAGTLFFFLSLFKLEQKLTQSKLNKSSVSLWSSLLGLSLGIIMSVKYWFPTIFLFISLMMVEAIRLKNWKIYLKSLIIGGLVYLLSYLVYFLEGNSLLQFLQFEWYRFNWFMGKTDAPPLLIFQTLFYGKYETHWDKGNYESTAYWSYLWPISFISSILAVIIDRLNNLRLAYLLGYSFLLLAIYSVGAAASDRFFIQLLPFWMIGGVFLISKLLDYYLAYDRKKTET